MSQWAKIDAKSSESEDIAALHAANPNAALLFLLALPQAVPWGVLPGTPALFRGRVCPLLDIGLDEVKTCLRLIIDQGLFVAYNDSKGKPLVFFATWNEHQGRQWDRVAPPQYDLPPCWTPPPGFAKGLQDAAKAHRSLTAKAVEERLLSAESKTSLRLVLAESKTSLAREVRSEKERQETPTSKACAADGDADLSAPPVDELPPTEPADLVLIQQDEPTETPSTDTPSQAASNACLALYGLTHKDLAEDAPKYFAAMGTLIGQLTGGAEELQAWADTEQRDAGLRKLGNGAKPAVAIPARVRKEVTASTWQDTFASARVKAKHNGQRFIDHAVNGRIYERDWDEAARRHVGLLIAGGVWDEERGMATDDKRHPSQQRNT